MKFSEFKDKKDITPWRKLLYYGGMALMATGLLLFLSVFLSAASVMNSPVSFGEAPGFMTRGVFGFILVFIGAVLRGVGARGLAGSGVVLDPERAREDLAPFTGALGGMARDAVESFREAGGYNGKAEAPQVMVRCRSCKALNREDAKYCDQCGAGL